MWEPPWKSLVETLTDSGFESPYLDRLRSRIEVALDRPSLEREILLEMAQALGRAGDKVDLAFLKLQLLQEQIDDAADAEERTRLMRTYNRQRLQAKRVLRELVIHREALGMIHNQHLAALYTVPPRKTI